MTLTSEKTLCCYDGGILTSLSFDHRSLNHADLGKKKYTVCILLPIQHDLSPYGSTLICEKRD